MNTTLTKTAKSVFCGRQSRAFFGSAFIVLTAQVDSRLESFSSGFREDRAQFNSGDVVVFVSGLVVVFAVLWLLARWSERRVRNDSSLGLFWTLSKAHELTWSDRWLLWRLARAKSLSEPALVFLDPRLTSPHSAYHIAPNASVRLKTLRRRFFAGIDQTDELPGESNDDTELSVQERPGSKSVALDPSLAHIPTFSPEGDLAEALNAIRELSLRDQPVRRPERTEDSAESEKAERPNRTAEFPAADSATLDLYPWLGSDWEITNADE